MHILPVEDNLDLGQDGLPVDSALLTMGAGWVKTVRAIAYVLAP